MYAHYGTCSKNAWSWRTLKRYKYPWPWYFSVSPQRCVWRFLLWRSNALQSREALCPSLGTGRQGNGLELATSDYRGLATSPIEHLVLHIELILLLPNIGTLKSRERPQVSLRLAGAYKLQNWVTRLIGGPRTDNFGNWTRCCLQPHSYGMGLYSRLQSTGKSGLWTKAARELLIVPGAVDLRSQGAHYDIDISVTRMNTPTSWACTLGFRDIVWLISSEIIQCGWLESARANSSRETPRKSNSRWPHEYSNVLGSYSETQRTRGPDFERINTVWVVGECRSQIQAGKDWLESSELSLENEHSKRYAPVLWALESQGIRY